MAKRGAGSELTDRNWDQEEEAEEAGLFVQADEGTLKNRQIRKAKRRNANEGGSPSSGAFKNFAGFTALAKKPEGAAAPTFNFGLGPTKPLDIANGTTAPKASTGFQFNTNPVGKGSDTKDAGNGQAKEDSTDRSKYLQQLKSLNQGVAKWIKDHVDKNPFIVLTPIFRDYEKHLADLEKKYPEHDEKKGATSSNGNSTSGKDTASVSDSKKSSSTSSTPPKYTFGLSTDASSPPKSTSTTDTKPVFGGTSSGSGFSFGSTDKSATSAFSFGSASSGSTGSALGGGFSFKSDVGASNKGFGTGGFSFATGANAGGSSKDTDAKGGGEEEEYVPPKPESSTIVEEDAIYTKRCKIFYQREGAWVEKGLGNLHLKPCGEKTQLLVRADTTLGNILLNIMLSPSLPMKRQGKNNVSLICIPNPPMDPKMEDKKPVSLLLRVKTAEDADELLEKLEENKGEQ